MLVLAKLFAMIYILGFPGSVTAGRRNITIDDQFGDERTHVVPTFMPTDDWIIGGTGGSVMPCRSLAYKGTWHDTTHRVGTPATSVSFGFTGECLYVYCIIANLERGSELYAFADYKFVVDGELVGRYTRVPEETNVPLYFINTLVYANTSMENRFHNFSIVLDSTVQPVLLLFDYAVYTIVEEDGANTTAPSSSTTPDVADTRSKSSSAVVVGSTLGAVAILFCAGLLTLVVANIAVIGSMGARNITIDDQFGDEITHITPTYSPSGNWRPEGIGGHAKPDASLAFRETWHDSTHRVGSDATVVNFGFTGVSLYVYCIIANNPPGPHVGGFADYKFFLENDLVGIYTHFVEDIPDYFFNTPVYVNTSLENKFHNFSIVLDSAEQPVLILFDYATYTTIEVVDGVSTTMSGPVSSSTPNQPLGTSTVKGKYGDPRLEFIACVTLGAISLVAVSVIIYHRVRKARMAAILSTVTPWRSNLPYFLENASHPVPPPSTKCLKVTRIPPERSRAMGTTGEEGAPPPYIM
ncbi:hypothetical protein EYR40_008591 [Pleurotus pulmonarius]|nr:hypothetical protein EYR38_008613 [Pleurotus pulmonarius]KAF4593797.1 hypothetical protein EYR40_008591 [Pleurotus pulmonarius]